MADTPTLEEVWELLQAMHEHDKADAKWKEMIEREYRTLHGMMAIFMERCRWQWPSLYDRFQEVIELHEGKDERTC